MVFSIKSLGTVANPTPFLHLNDLLMSLIEPTKSMRPSPSPTFTLLVDTMKYFFIDVSTTDFTEEKRVLLKTSGLFFYIFSTDFVSNKSLKKFDFDIALPPYFIIRCTIFNT